MIDSLPLCAHGRIGGYRCPHCLRVAAHLLQDADGSMVRCGGPGVCPECSEPTCAVCHEKGVAHHGVLCPDCLDEARANFACRVP